MRVEYTARATRDLAVIFDFIERRSPKGAQNVRNEIERQIQSLAEFPLLGPAIPASKVRKIAITRYPYLVYYSVEDALVSIIHVRDTRREPWRFRA